MFTLKHKIKRRILLSLYASASLIVAFTLTFSPMATPKPIPIAEAGGKGGGGLATEASQLRNVAQNTISAIENRAQTIFQGQISLATVGNFLKENVLDGIGWTIAKTVLSSMVRSLINWVNSGFQGSPAFITDLRQHLIGVLDEAAGEFIRSLGGIGEFVCSPFRLDVQAALAINYAQARSGMPSGPDQNLCRLSDIGSNIENFFNSTSNSWDDWLQVTSNPQNTPLGAYFAAEASLNARLINEAGQEIQVANWGSGILSLKACEAIEGRSGGENCTITTPGRVISESLTFMTSSGPRTLIEADEINELVGALLNQLILQVVQGINGLLGLGGNAAYASYDSEGRTFLDRMAEEAGTVNSELIANQISRSITLEQSYLRLIDETITRGEAQIAGIEAEEARAAAAATSTPDGTTPIVATPSRRDEDEPSPREIRAIITEAEARRASVATTLATLTSIQSRIGSGATTTPATAEDPRGVFRLDQATTSSGRATSTVDRATAERTAAFNEYNELVRRNALTNEGQIQASYTRWSEVIDGLTRPQL